MAWSVRQSAEYIKYWKGVFPDAGFTPFQSGLIECEREQLFNSDALRVFSSGILWQLKVETQVERARYFMTAVWFLLPFCRKRTTRKLPVRIRIEPIHWKKSRLSEKKHIPADNDITGLVINSGPVIDTETRFNAIVIKYWPIVSKTVNAVPMT